MTAFNINFTHAYTQDGPKGPRTVRTGLATRDFWQAWRQAGAEELRERGFKPRKVQDKWYVDQFIDTPAGAEVIDPNPPYILKNRKGLLPYQAPHTAALVAALIRHGSALDASDAGTGKTYVAFAVARETGLIPAIVCPKSVMGSWQRCAAFFGIKPYFIMNWEGCKTAKFPHGTVDKNTDEYTWKLAPSRILLIFDEAHKGKGEYSQNAKMVIAAKEQKIPTLLLSATIGSGPRDLRAIGYMLGLHNLFDFHKWSVGLGCYQVEYKSGTGWSCADPVAAMGQVHRMLFPAKGSRMRIADLGDAFPETQITADLYPIAKAKAQNKAYDELLHEIATLKREKKEGWAAAAMVLNLRYRQMSELLKTDVLIALTKEALENNLSVVIFVNFRKTLHELHDAFPGSSLIHGLQTPEERQAAIDAFQADKARVTVAQIMAGGVGVSLHDLHGRHPRMALICPTYSAKDLKQALGRVHRAQGKSKSLQRIVYAEGTIEEQVCRTVAQRLEAISSLNDGDLFEKDLLGVLGRAIEVEEEPDEDGELEDYDGDE